MFVPIFIFGFIEGWDWSYVINSFVRSIQLWRHLIFNPFLMSINICPEKIFGSRWCRYAIPCLISSTSCIPNQTKIIISLYPLFRIIFIDFIDFFPCFGKNIFFIIFLFFLHFQNQKFFIFESRKVFNWDISCFLLIYA